jgi:hypothetical protein
MIFPDCLCETRSRNFLVCSGYHNVAALFRCGFHNRFLSRSGVPLPPMEIIIGGSLPGSLAGGNEGDSEFSAFARSTIACFLNGNQSSCNKVTNGSAVAAVVAAAEGIRHLPHAESNAPVIMTVEAIEQGNQQCAGSEGGRAKCFRSKYRPRYQYVSVSPTIVTVRRFVAMLHEARRCSARTRM